MRQLICLSLFSLLTFIINAQTISSSDLQQMVLCKDFKCFQKIATEHGITMAENPYDHSTGKHQIIFNAKYKDANEKIYSVGISFLTAGSTRAFVRTKSQEYFNSLINELTIWGAFGVKQGVTKDDDGTLYTTYGSKKEPLYELRTDVYFDKEDDANYYIVKLIKLK